MRRVIVNSKTISPVIDEMKQKGFYISNELEYMILEQAKEK